MSIIDENYIFEDRKSENEQSFFDKLFTFKPFSPNTIVKDLDFQFSTPNSSYSNFLALQNLLPHDTVYPYNNSLKQALALQSLEE